MLVFLRRLALAILALGSMSWPHAALATNGMNLEGYGAIATGMGGASMAFDNGTAALMNNPATLGLIGEGRSRLDLALGFLGPDITAQTDGVSDANSSATAFYMPAAGWIRRSGAATYGVGMFAQGGMGTEYAKDSFLALGTGEKVRSEVSVGRLMAPVAYDVGNGLIVAATLDYVWANMDMKAAFNKPQLMALYQDGNITGSGSFFQNLGMALQMQPGLVARFDFSDGSPYSGQAKGTGFASKLGALYQLSPTLALGAAYHGKTSLSDLKATGAKMRMYGDGDANGFADSTQASTFRGEITVKDFEWPAMLGAGAAWRPMPELLVALDYKQIQWSGTMKNFIMRFDPSDGSGNMTVKMPQKWQDQTVYALGAAYQTTQALTVRAGYNRGQNPIPGKYLNPLFPATVETHFTIGGGYLFSPDSELNASITQAPEVSSKNPGDPANGIPAVTVKHGQMNWQMLYTMRL